MALEQPLVEGPAWTGIGLEESPGRYPLRVEAAVSRIVERLLPGVITTTRHARMYAVHALGWAHAEQQKMDKPAAEEFVRRCEVVVAAVHHCHASHRIQLSTAHGEDRVHLFVHDGVLDVDRAARRGGLSEAGFAGVYQGPCVRIGALSEGQPPRRGARADLNALQEGLAGLPDLAVRDAIPLDELRAASHLCTCQAAGAADGRWLRRILVEEAEADHPEDRYRQLTCLLLLDTLEEQRSTEPLRAFGERWAFGGPYGDTDADDRALVASMWRAAALRNYSVSAWRGLWRWLAAQLNEQPMTAEDLGDRLADALEDMTVRALIRGLPDRCDGDLILRAEALIAARAWTPTEAVRQLALGAQRLGDLEGATLQAFVGMDPTDLGPRWVSSLLEEWADRHVRDLAHELAVMLVRRAKRVALSKMYLTKSGRPFVPTRLRDRDGILSVRGEEGAGDVALRIDSLTQVLAGLGTIDRDENGAYFVSELGETLRAQLN